MEDRPMCTCGSPVRQKGRRQDGTPVWRSKCSRCETRVVETMVSTDLVEEMQRTQALRGELQVLQVAAEEQKKHILKIEAEKVDLGSTLEKERQDRANAEGDLKTRIEKKSAQVNLLRDERNSLKEEIKALEAKIDVMRELTAKDDEIIQDLQTKLTDRGEEIDDLKQIVENLAKESRTRLDTLTEARRMWSESSERMQADRDQRVQQAYAALNVKHDQVEALQGEQRRLTAWLKASGACLVIAILILIGAIAL